MKSLLRLDTKTLSLSRLCCAVVMDQEQVITALLTENGKLGKENDQLNWTLDFVKENQALRSRMDAPEELTGTLFLPLDGNNGADTTYM